MSKENIRLKIDGFSDVVRNLEAFPKEVYEEVQSHIEKAANRILDDARSKTPELTGELKRGYRLELKGDLSRSSVYAKVVNHAPHAHLIEYGHVMTTNNRGRGRGRAIKVVPAQPFIRPALEANTNQVISDLTNGVNEALDRMESKAK
jgi:HK97 gp10 family phage protein